jgi:hypothetical protein
MGPGSQSKRSEDGSVRLTMGRPDSSFPGLRAPILEFSRRRTRLDASCSTPPPCER